MSEKLPEKPNSKVKRSTDEYLKYSGMAFQMALIIGLGAFVGQKVDAKLEVETPWFTILFLLIGVALALYVVLKDLIAPKK